MFRGASSRAYSRGAGGFRNFSSANFGKSFRQQYQSSSSSSSHRKYSSFAQYAKAAGFDFKPSASGKFTYQAKTTFASIERAAAKRAVGIALASKLPLLMSAAMNGPGLFLSELDTGDEELDDECMSLSTVIFIAIHSFVCRASGHLRRALDSVFLIMHLKCIQRELHYVPFESIINQLLVDGILAALFGGRIPEKSVEIDCLSKLDEEDGFQVEKQQIVFQHIQQRKWKLWLIIGCLSALFITVFSLSIALVISRDGQISPADRPNPVILISLDGFAARYLQRQLTPNLQRLIDNGVHAPFMQPEFPSKTFPNHWSIVTGLLSESHGIVSNQFYDPVIDDVFTYTNDTCSKDPRWWLGEPIWNTIKRQQLSSNVCFWPGSEAPVNGMHPDRYIPYSQATEMDNSARVDQVLEWLGERYAWDQTYGPDLIAMYISSVDSTGHANGPDSSAVDEEIKRVDTDAIGRLIDGLKARNALDYVNLVIVSDHGMAATDPNKVVYLEDIQTSTGLNVTNYITVYDGSPVLHIQPHNDSVADVVYTALKEQSVKDKTWNVYKRGEIPPIYQYSNSNRISPIILVADQPYTISQKRGDYFLKGTHGYDPRDSDMHSIFIGHGPQFAKNSTIAESSGMSNLDVYKILCALLNVNEAPNNSTLQELSFIVPNEFLDPRK
ncbi:hypothetical protein MIR68_001415 [Amoeboaphelidium protococcarum]|nr:hypothetical protein MIR68_001415 [Amoeboaphelidium protococcarum]